MARLLLAGCSIEALSLCRRVGHTVAAVCDPTLTDGGTWHNIPSYKADGEAIRASSVDGVVVAIDSPKHRNRVQSAFARQRVPVVDIVDGRLGDGVRCGVGLFLQSLANLSEGSTAGAGARLNIGAIVMHEAMLGDFVTVAPGATLLGRVTVGSEAYIGAGSVVLPELTIGAGAIIGAGAVVTRDVAAGAVVKGNPAR